MLELRRLRVRYGSREVIYDVDLRVEAGEIVTLIGSNGVGKTTILKAISGLLAGASGEVSFDGKAILGMAPHDVLALGLAHVPEGRLLFPGLSVLDHLELGALRGERAAYAGRLQEMFDLFPVLRERQRQLAGTLSGGEQQMLAIARGLMSGPKLLMLDEPSLGLAPVIVDTVMDVLQRLNARGISILIVEQRVDVALRLASRGYVLDNGRIVLEDTASRLLENPAVVQAYLGA